MTKFKNYIASATLYTFLTVEFEAENDDEAWQLAVNMDGGDFKAAEDGDWKIVSVDEITKETT
jgi:hypothetical protein